MRSSHVSFALAAVGLSLTVTFACNLLVGLDKFDKVDCGVGQCQVDATNDASVDASPPDGNLGDVISNPAKWAHWQMPNPVYDAGITDADLHYVQYTSSPDGGTVSEMRTGLVWYVGGFSLSNSNLVAEAYCAMQTAANLQWRVPTRIELATLIDFSVPAPHINKTLFSVVTGTLWSSSPDRTKSGSYWSVSFNEGITMVSLTTGDHILCVSGGK